MKLLTLNAHSWLEDQQEDKIKVLLDFILDQEIDFVCLQEVNQNLTSPVEKDPLHYMPVDNYFDVPIREDNFILTLVKDLAQRGHDYYWSWVPAHLSYGKMDEGVGVLAKEPFLAHEVPTSTLVDYRDFHTRRVLRARFDDLDIYSVHFSRWDDQWEDTSFKGEWLGFKDHLDSERLTILAGDFNNDSQVKDQGYDFIQKTLPYLKDSYYISSRTKGNITAPGDIAGWDGNQDNKRIDYIWLSQKLAAHEHRVVFTGQEEPIVSDHFGIYLTFDYNDN
ncbi:endonuclease/exonuclease/phosphatase family protein [Aerococcus kribbianus]|uniref:Endonuclease/exonuclease/phosphatase family protein n=1 Tax=Aerococcus kribbianus TaxID=2999064 RepID=A0A9X3FNM5_9LACT|nr:MULTISPECIES: endonuclease/exonuclease/phosphatase family protein [unclassified Aerococcus]MCZ0716863.1 endonuclease/exonuclease/phosphatase family protein [Aerococcus sp. YH-aer221]MCZ0725151.1 endonuclease/exonuclease/phosphatase family protein [Aerococcus sp. YH-aer222]